MAVANPFYASCNCRSDGPFDHGIAGPPGFEHGGTLVAVGETPGDHEDYRRAIFIVNGLTGGSEKAAQALAVLMNRAHALGMLAART